MNEFTESIAVGDAICGFEVRIIEDPNGGRLYRVIDREGDGKGYIIAATFPPDSRRINEVKVGQTLKILRRRLSDPRGAELYDAELALSSLKSELNHKYNFTLAEQTLVLSRILEQTARFCVSEQHDSSVVSEPVAIAS